MDALGSYRDCAVFGAEIMGAKGRDGEEVDGWIVAEA